MLAIQAFCFEPQNHEDIRAGGKIIAWPNSSFIGRKVSPERGNDLTKVTQGLND